MKLRREYWNKRERNWRHFSEATHRHSIFDTADSGTRAGHASPLWHLPPLQLCLNPPRHNVLAEPATASVGQTLFQRCLKT
jgi:hypothetical protein